MDVNRKGINLFHFLLSNMGSSLSTIPTITTIHVSFSSLRYHRVQTRHYKASPKQAKPKKELFPFSESKSSKNLRIAYLLIGLACCCNLCDCAQLVAKLTGQQKFLDAAALIHTLRWMLRTTNHHGILFLQYMAPF